MFFFFFFIWRNLEKIVGSGDIGFIIANEHWGEFDVSVRREYNKKLESKGTLVFKPLIYYIAAER